MKGNKMKDKITVAIVCALFIGLVWIGSTSHKASSNESFVSEETVPILSENTTMDLMDYNPFENTRVEKPELQTEISALNTCTLESVDTDALMFGEAFGYYRQCLGADSSFQWKDMEYTTLFSDEMIIQVADSVGVDEKPEGADISQIR
jgi:hypothetical protein